MNIFLFSKMVYNDHIQFFYFESFRFEEGTGMKTHWASMGKALAVVISLVAVMGVFSNSYAKDKKFGRIQYNPDVIPVFGSAAPLPANMDIYFSGPADRPYAVIGIIKGTPFDPNIWRPISEEAENIGKWRQMIHDYNDMLARPYFGYDILDPDGKVVGKWISYQRETVVKMTKENKISVYTPDGPRRFSDDPQRIGP
jgi:hypothetical protein